jgi:multiple antibiotic resistance protein
MFRIAAILSTYLILFSVIDIIGSLPVILDMKEKGVRIHPFTSTIAAGVLMVAFLFFGTAIL